MLKLSFFLQKAFVAERTDLIENNRKKWEASVQQRRDKEVKCLSIPQPGGGVLENGWGHYIWHFNQ